MMSYRKKQNISRILLYFILIVIGLLYIFPFFWMVLSSFKLQKDVLSIPFKFFPPKWNITSYSNVFNFPGYNFGRYFINSVIVLLCTLLLCIFFSTTSGYGFAKYKFKGKIFLFIVILSTMMIPFQAIILPLFILVRTIGIQNTYLGLIVPISISAFGVFMMRQFFYSVPNEYIESARIDGASEYYIFLRISIPMAKTAILALVIFHGQWVWNLLIWPLIVISTPKLRTLPQAISQFTGVYFTPYPEQLAISVVACLPLLVLYMFSSKYFVSSIAATGIK